MKKVLATLSASLMLFVASCSNEDINFQDTTNASLSTKSSQIQFAIENYKSKQSYAKGDRVTFNFESIEETHRTETGLQIFTVYETNYSEESPIKTVMQFIAKDGNVIDEMIVQTEEVNTTTKTLSFFETDWEQFGGFEFNTQNQTMRATTNKLRKKGSCGQAVMDCINDVYTNHGWISVWAWVQTAYIPATGLALAAACYDRNC